MTQPPVDREGRGSWPGRPLPGSAGRRDESELERWDRNFAELLQELRMAQTGPQVLLAFLLTVPFTNRFPSSDGVQKGVYAVTLLAAAAAAVLLIAPVSYHRRIFRQGRKAELVRMASLLAELGLASLALAIVGTVFIALDVALDRVVAIAAGVGVALAAVGLWYWLPTLNKLRLYRRVVAPLDPAETASQERDGVTAEPRDRRETR